MDYEKESKSVEYFKHRFENVEDYLHHRSPYLMVDNIDEIESDSIRTSKQLVETDFPFSGHFPGSPIFPGALMQEVNTQSAGIWLAAERNPMSVFDTHDPFANEFALGVLVQVDRARYRRFARPGDSLSCEVKFVSEENSLFEFTGALSCGSEKVMRIRFRLANIRSDLLSGTAMGE